MNSCALCKKDGADSVMFESGNNAEIPVEVMLCEDHLTECMELGHEFDAKYGPQILELAEASFHE